jgi:defect-in-organelle-trafficking protein DotC
MMGRIDMARTPSRNRLRRVSAGLGGLCFGLLVSAGAARAESEQSLENLTSGSQTQAVAHYDVMNARMTAVGDAAKATGVAWGYHHEMKNLESEILAEKGALNQVYNFQPYLLRGHVLPPVVEAGSHAAKFNSSTRATFALRTFKIIHAARIISNPPDWREWLLPANPRPSPTHSILLPKTEAERALWKSKVAEGWAYGIAQARAVEMQNLHRLTRTITGMIMFMRLRSEGMVSGPVVIAGEPTIKVGRKSLSIGTRIFTISQGAGFASQKDWSGPAPYSLGSTQPNPMNEQ